MHLSGFSLQFQSGEQESHPEKMECKKHKIDFTEREITLIYSITSMMKCFCQDNHDFIKNEKKYYEFEKDNYKENQKELLKLLYYQMGDYLWAASEYSKKGGGAEHNSFVLPSENGATPFHKAVLKLYYIFRYFLDSFEQSCIGFA